MQLPLEMQWLGGGVVTKLLKLGLLPCFQIVRIRFLSRDGQAQHALLLNDKFKE